MEPITLRAPLDASRRPFVEPSISLMEPVALRAHFDGKQILLDEPFELEPNARLIITVLRKSLGEGREGWAGLALESLGRAYGDDEPEYSLDSIKEANPEYEGR